MAATAKTKKIKQDSLTDQNTEGQAGASGNEERFPTRGSAITNTDELERFLHESQRDKKICGTS